MKAQIIYAILTCFHLSLVGGLDHNGTDENGSSDPSRRILHGDIAEPEDYKYMVLLEGYLIPCGGAIITNHFILTAAHCLAHQPCKAIKIFASTWALRATTLRHAVECLVPGEYNMKEPLYYNIGLVKASEDLLTNPEFQTIPLPPPGMKFEPGTKAHFAGWGVTETNGVSSYLRYGKVLIEDWQICNHRYKNHGRICTYREDDLYDADIPRRSLCTQGQGSYPPGACIGDFGGPLIINGVAAGIISATYASKARNCADGAPTVHVNVADYLPWIYGIIEPERDTSNITVTEEYNLG